MPTAYKNLYANAGAATKGIDDDTADGFGVKYVSDITESLKSLEYSPPYLILSNAVWQLLPGLNPCELSLNIGS